MSFSDQLVRNQPAEQAVLSVARRVNEVRGHQSNSNLRDQIATVLLIILAMDVRDQHDELLEVVRTWSIDYKFDSGFSHPLAHEVIINLERQKREAQAKKHDAAFIAALGDEGEGENRSQE